MRRSLLSHLAYCAVLAAVAIGTAATLWLLLQMDRPVRDWLRSPPRTGQLALSYKADVDCLLRNWGHLAEA
jgi:hypothetical protein